MALIACGECGKQISDKAAACPHCGAPTPSASGTGSTKGIVTTQQTSKIFKVFQLIGVLIIIAGVVACVGKSPGESTIGSTGLSMLGLLIYAGARIGAWWRNG